MAIAGPDTPADTMLDALAYTIAALGVAAEQDIDRTDEDRQFFAAERDGLQGHYDALTQARDALLHHERLVFRRAQAAVVLGDAVLDRGVSKSKARMKVETKEGADHVFGKDVSELIEAPRDQEPALVLGAVGRFTQVADFPGKADMAADLTKRATQQQANFANRTAAEVQEESLSGAGAIAIKAGADALYGLEKKLLDRFKRETRYAGSRPRRAAGRWTGAGRGRTPEVARRVMRAGAGG